MVTDWLEAFGTARAAGDGAALAALFHPDASWRDLLTFTWNILTTEGRDAIAALLLDTRAEAAATHWRATAPAEAEGDTLAGWFAFETALARGGGWEVTVRRDGGTVTLSPRDLVFATGACGPPRPIDWPGAADFRGTLVHSSAYRDGAAFAGRRAVVVGAGSSAQDIAQNLWESGAAVTLVQRSPSIVVRSETLMEEAFALYSEGAVARGITVDRADLIAAATPYSRMSEGQRAICARIRDRDRSLYDRLAARGFLTTWGEDDTGLMLRALRTASGYDIDVGCADLIADGQIAVVSGAGVARMTPETLVLTDGRTVPAEVVVACIGYQSMHETVAAVVDRATACAVGPCWGLGSGVPGDPGPWLGELRNMWKPTAVEGLWFHGGNLALSRFYSRILALQLKARSLGLPTPVRGRPADQRGR
jgi:putative flavoprotein involved in K+ transport